jgi:hypothetical protein
VYTFNFPAITVNVTVQPSADVVAALQALGAKMSALTDQVDAALATLATDSSNFASILATVSAARDALQAQVTALEAGQTVDQGELQKALDGMNASHAALTGITPPATPPATPPNAPPTNTPATGP